MTDRRDPTRSAGLRKHGRALVTRKVFNLHRELRNALQEGDVAGLRQSNTPPPIAFINWVETNSHKLMRSEGAVETIIGRTLMQPYDWTRSLIERSVARGLEQVEKELRTSLEHLDPREVSRLHTAAAISEVRGIAGETERRVLRLVVRALEIKAAPEALMREVRTVLEKITRLRLNLMVNTSVVRAVNAGKLFAYATEGIEKVGIDPEWVPRSATHQHDSLAVDCSRGAVGVLLDAKRKRKKRKKSVEEQILASGLLGPGARAAGAALEALEQATLVNILTAGDDRVCDDCDQIAAEGPYDIDTARDLIPAHPNCRCAFVPWGDARFAPIEEMEE